MRPARQLRSRVVTFGIACDGVRLVDDEQVPGIVRQRLDDVPLFHEVERRDPHTRPAPRVLAVGAPPRQRVQFVAIGRDIEATVIARAVKFHLEHRVLINGERTVVFR